VIELTVWKLLRSAKGKWPVKGVCYALNIDSHAASTALRRLLKKGCVTAEGATRNRYYTATDKRPEDMRGTAVGTLAVLHKQVAINMERQGTRKPRKPRQYRPKLALERHWRREEV
jgi:predicted transcriptional regulator